MEYVSVVRICFRQIILTYFARVSITELLFDWFGFNLTSRSVVNLA